MTASIKNSLMHDSTPANSLYREGPLATSYEVDTKNVKRSLVDAKRSMKEEFGLSKNEIFGLNDDEISTQLELDCLLWNDNELPIKWH